MNAKETHPTRILMAEHEAIKTMLRVLENLASRLEAGERVDPEHIRMALDFIVGFADRCHHAKEENLLFPAMEAVGVPRQGGPIGVMLTEHEEGRRHVRAMKEAADRLAKGEMKAGFDFARHARDYASLLSEHIFKEDNILYAMADARLSPADQENLRAAFQKVEEEIVGPGQHSHFEAILEELRSKYC
ncbi:MAG: hemerythrin domain-containing protein [Candidatus Aminicenantales bacterium]